VVGGPDETVVLVEGQDRHRVAVQEPEPIPRVPGPVRFL
jgi:hypothetical protein